jgi:parallel beta-helix repeat protein
MSTRASLMVVVVVWGTLLAAGCSGMSTTPTPASSATSSSSSVSGVTSAGSTVATLSASAGRRTIVVDDGADCANADYTSIQAAVNAANPDTTILVCAGTYSERVVISKNGLRLLAQGAPDTVVLDGNNKANFAGNHAFRVLNVSDVLIEGFMVREYFENIRLEGGGGNTVRNNRSTDAGHDPFIVLNSANNVVEQNVGFDNLGGNACGVNIQGAGSQGNLIRNNLLTNNNWGIRIQAGATNNTVFGNESRGNRSRGIQNIGATSNGTTIENNRVEDNPIGIEVNASSGVTVARNHVFHNTTFDLLNTGVNTTFVNNHCGTSNPAGLCEHSEGNSK